MKRVTIGDVANKAGVSISTVSYALSNKRQISDETRSRIFQVIDELNYRPNLAAKQLASGEKSKNIGYVLILTMPEITTLEMKFIAGAARTINQAGYTFILLAHTDLHTENFAHFARSSLVDGFILGETNLYDERVEILRKASIPFVTIGRCADNTGFFSVDQDIDNSFEDIVDYFQSCGRQTVAFIHQDNPNFTFVANCLKAFEAACLKYHLIGITRTCGLSQEDGERAMNSLLDDYPQVSAVYVWSDIPTLGVIQAVESRGRKIPVEFTIACQEHSTIASLSSFLPSVLDIQAEELSSQAAGMLIDILENRPVSETQKLIKAKLIHKAR